VQIRVGALMHNGFRLLAGGIAGSPCRVSRLCHDAPLEGLSFVTTGGRLDLGLPGYSGPRDSSQTGLREIPVSRRDGRGRVSWSRRWP